MKNILVPCDFSKPSINAFQLALDVAGQSGGTIYLLHVIELPVLHDPILEPLSIDGELKKQLQPEAEAEFKKILTRYNHQNIKVIAKVQFGAVHKTILDYITDQSIDIVVMGSHGASGLSEVFIGSNAERIVRWSPIPVLIIKSYFKGLIKNIVFPNTLEKDNQEDLISKVKALQNFFGAKLHIVWINTPLNFTSDIITHERLKAFVTMNNLKNCTTNIFNSLDEEKGILEFARMIKGELIAMGTHSRRGISHLLKDSLAESVVNHADELIWTYSLRNEPVKV